jgi:hypothetical protein
MGEPERPGGLRHSCSRTCTENGKSRQAIFCRGKRKGIIVCLTERNTVAMIVLTHLWGRAAEQIWIQNIYKAGADTGAADQILVPPGPMGEECGGICVSFPMCPRLLVNSSQALHADQDAEGIYKSSNHQGVEAISNSPSICHGHGVLVVGPMYMSGRPTEWADVRI